MVYRRKNRRTKRTYRKKRATRRRFSGAGTMSIKRSCALAANVAAGIASDNVIWNQSTRSTGYFNFSLSDLPNNGEITALFSMYKLTGVSLRFIPLAGTDATAGSTTLMDTFAFNIDKSVRGVPANMDEILESGNCRIISGCQRPFKVWIPYPKAGTVISGSTAQMTTPWLDSDANQVKHFGLRYAFQQSLASASVRFAVYATYYFRVKYLK